MKNRKNRLQRQEVRRILTAMRKELKDYRIEYEDLPGSRPVMHFNEFITRARNRVQDNK
jgi:hypothetical protein